MEDTLQCIPVPVPVKILLPVPVPADFRFRSRSSGNVVQTMPNLHNYASGADYAKWGAFQVEKLCKFCYITSAF